MTDKFETKEGRGQLFKAKKRPKETSPEYTGEIRVEGKLYWLSGWVNEGRSGQKYFSLSVQPKDEDGSPGRPSGPSQKPSTDVDDDDIPF